MVHTAESKTLVILFSKVLAHLRSKRTGEFSPHTIHRFKSHWRHSKTRMTKRIYLILFSLTADLGWDFFSFVIITNHTYVSVRRGHYSP